MGKEVKTFRSKVNGDKIFESYFKSLNGILKLTDKELQVASVLYKHKNKLNKSIIDNNIANNVLFSSDYRKVLRAEIDITPMGFNNLLSSLRNKKIISDDNKLNKSLELNVENGVQVIFDISLDENVLQEG